MNSPATARTISPEAFQRGLRQQLFSADPATRLYAVLDGASIPGLLSRLYAKPCPDFISLYRGELEREIAKVSPYLVALERGSRFTDWLLDEGWGRHWGLFAASPATFTDLRKHFRKFLRVQLPDGKPFYFRFYDPRVWRVFLPTADGAQLAKLFGRIDYFACEGAGLDEALRFELERGQLRARVFRAGHEETLRPVEFPAAAGKQGTVTQHNGAGGLLLRIRQEQLDAFAAPRSEQLPRKVAEYLRTECPKETTALSDAELDSLIHAGFERAARHGINVEWDLCRFCWLAALYGLEFDEERDWARKILASADQTASERMDRLEYYQQNYLVPMYHQG